MAQPRIARARAQSNVRTGPREESVAAAPDHTRRPVPAFRVIETEEDVRAGVRALRRKCAIMRRVHETAGDPPLRRQAPGFQGLARIIVGQQLSVASAAAIWKRTIEACAPFEPRALLSLSDAQLVAAGLSRPKIRTLRAAAEACANGLDLTALERLPEEHIHNALTEVVGIGPWTADVYIMFSLGRADAWAPGDLALQVAAQRAMDLPERPNADTLKEIGERWRPWRGAAARLLWAYYAAVKRQGSALPV
jgi:DNA-3-methyladenine glycosylase II